MTTSNYVLPHLIGELPEYLGELALTVSAKLNVDFGMALTTLLSGMASAVHGVRAVRRPDGGLEPLALFCVVLSGSGTGKTRTHKLVHAPHGAHDVRRYEAFQRAAQAGTRACLRDVIQPLTSNRFLLKSLEGVGQATAISAHEGKTLLNSYFFRQQLELVNVLWDGDDKITLPLSTGERLMAFDASLNLLVMVQPEIFQDYFAKHGDTARSVGFIPRCLFTIADPCPPGVRCQAPPPSTCLDEYYKDVTAYLDLQYEQLEAPERDAPSFSPAACAARFQLQRELEQPSVFQYPGARDAAARALQNVTRVAGVIHSYYPRRPDDSRMRSGGTTAETEISLATLKAAWAIVEGHLRQFAEIFPSKPFRAASPPKAGTQQKRQQRILDDAETIMVHFRAHCERKAESSAPKSAVVTRSGLYPLRFETALIHLIDGNYLTVEGSGKKTRLSLGPRPFVAPSAFGQGYASSSSL